MSHSRISAEDLRARRALAGLGTITLLALGALGPGCIGAPESDDPGADDHASVHAEPLISPLKINFQVATSAVPSGYVADTGAVFGARAGGRSYGWNVDHTSLARERAVHADQRLDTLVHFHAGGKWELAVPAGDYDVTVSVGDPSYASTHLLDVEGVSFVPSTALAAGQFKTVTKTVHVSDGRLTLDQGSLPEMSTRIDYLEIKDAAPKGLFPQFGYYVWGSVPMSSNADKVKLPEVKGYGRFYNWSDLQTGPNTFNWAALDADLAYAASIGKQLFIHIREVRYALNATNVNQLSWVPQFIRNDPQYGGTHPGSYGTLFCPDECANGQTKTNWPRYPEAAYQAAHASMVKQVAAHLRAHPSWDHFEGIVDNETSWAGKPAQWGGHTGVTQAWKTRAAHLRAAFPDRTVLISPNWIAGDGGASDPNLKTDLYSLIDEHTQAGPNNCWTPPDTNSLLDDALQHDILFPKARQNVKTNYCAYWIQAPDYNFPSWRHPGSKVTPEELLDILRPPYAGEVVPANPARPGEKEPRIGFRYVFVFDWNGSVNMWNGPIPPGTQKTYPEVMKQNIARRPYPWTTFNSL